MADSDFPPEPGDGFRARFPRRILHHETAPQTAIQSFGIVAYVKTDTGVKFLLHQKRDTFAYVEFVRGLWYNESQIPILLSHMTTDEKKRLTRCTFKEMWNDLWVDKTMPMYFEGFQKAQKKFESTILYLPHLLENSTPGNTEPYWAFPKGRRERNETCIVCAKREFTEETRLDHSKLSWLSMDKKDLFFERFYGLNGKMFTTTYFLAQYPTEEVPERLQLEGTLRTSTISGEAYDLRWMTFVEAIELLEPFRKHVLIQARDRIVDKMIQEERESQFMRGSRTHAWSDVHFTRVVLPSVIPSDVKADLSQASIDALREGMFVPTLLGNTSNYVRRDTEERPRGTSLIPISQVDDDSDTEYRISSKRPQLVARQTRNKK